MRLPKRKHTGCDPMCEECQEWMYRVMHLMKPVAHEAMKAFWNVVFASAPSLEPSALSEHATELVTNACEEAAGDWAVEALTGVAEQTAVQTPKAAKKVLRFEPNARGDQSHLPFSYYR